MRGPGFYSQRRIRIFKLEMEKFAKIKYNARRSKIRRENKKTATSNGEKTQFHRCERISQIWINRPQIPDSLSPLTGVTHISQVVCLDTGEQSPEEGRGIKKRGHWFWDRGKCIYEMFWPVRADVHALTRFQAYSLRLVQARSRSYFQHSVRPQM